MSLAQNISLAPNLKTSYDYRILENQDVRDGYEKGKINYSLGIDLIKEFKSNFGLKTGIRYLKIGYKTNDEDLIWPSEHDGQGGYDPNPILPFSGTIEHVYEYIQVPVNLRYYLNSGKTKFYCDGGLMFNIAKDESWLNEYDFNRLNTSVNLGLA